MKGDKRPSGRRIVPAIIGLLCILASNAFFVERIGAEDKASRSKADALHSRDGGGSIHKKIHAKAKKPEERQIVGVFTAYTPKVKGKARMRRLTADETDLKESFSCVVANNKLRLGTRITIEGVGTCEVHDRIGKKVGANRFDIFMQADPGCAKDFGRRKLKYIVEHG